MAAEVHSAQDLSTKKTLTSLSNKHEAKEEIIDLTDSVSDSSCVGVEAPSHLEPSHASQKSGVGKCRINDTEKRTSENTEGAIQFIECQTSNDKHGKYMAHLTNSSIQTRAKNDKMTDSNIHVPHEKTIASKSPKVSPKSKMTEYVCVSSEKTMGVKSSKSISPKSPKTCKECGKVFEDPALFVLHKKMHARQKPFHCTRCRKSFTSYVILMQHLLVHSKPSMNEIQSGCNARNEPNWLHCVKSGQLPLQDERLISQSDTQSQTSVSTLQSMIFNAPVVATSPQHRSVSSSSEALNTSGVNSTSCLNTHSSNIVNERLISSSSNPVTSTEISIPTTTEISTSKTSVAIHSTTDNSSVSNPDAFARSLSLQTFRPSFHDSPVKIVLTEDGVELKTICNDETGVAEVENEANSIPLEKQTVATVEVTTVLKVDVSTEQTETKEDTSEDCRQNEDSLRSPSWYPRCSSAEVNESQVWEKMVDEEGSPYNSDLIIAACANRDSPLHTDSAPDSPSITHATYTSRDSPLHTDNSQNPSIIRIQGSVAEENPTITGLLRKRQTTSSHSIAKPSNVDSCSQDTSVSVTIGKDNCSLNVDSLNDSGPSQDIAVSLSTVKENSLQNIDSEKDKCSTDDTKNLESTTNSNIEVDYEDWIQQCIKGNTTSPKVKKSENNINSSSKSKQKKSKRKVRSHKGSGEDVVNTSVKDIHSNGLKELTDNKLALLNSKDLTQGTNDELGKGKKVSAPDHIEISHSKDSVSVSDSTVESYYKVSGNDDMDQVVSSTGDIEQISDAVSETSKAECADGMHVDVADKFNKVQDTCSNMEDISVTKSLPEVTKDEQKVGKPFYGTGAVISQKMLARIAELQGKVKKPKKHKKKKRKSGSEFSESASVSGFSDIECRKSETMSVATLTPCDTDVSSSVNLFPIVVNAEMSQAEVSQCPKKNKKKKSKKDKCKESEGLKKKKKKCKECKKQGIKCVHVKKKKKKKHKLDNLPTASSSLNTSSSVLESDLISEFSVNLQSDKSVADTNEITELESGSEGMDSMQDVSPKAAIVRPRKKLRSSSSPNDPEPAPQRVLRNRNLISKPKTLEVGDIKSVPSVNNYSEQLPATKCKLTRLPNGRLLREITGPIPYRSQLAFLKLNSNLADNEMKEKEHDTENMIVKDTDNKKEEKEHETEHVTLQAAITTETQQNADSPTVGEVHQETANDEITKNDPETPETQIHVDHMPNASENELHTECPEVPPKEHRLEATESPKQLEVPIVRETDMSAYRKPSAKTTKAKTAILAEENISSKVQKVMTESLQHVAEPASVIQTDITAYRKPSPRTKKTKTNKKFEWNDIQQVISSNIKEKKKRKKPKECGCPVSIELAETLENMILGIDEVSHSEISNQMPAGIVNQQTVTFTESHNADATSLASVLEGCPLISAAPMTGSDIDDLDSQNVGDEEESDITQPTNISQEAYTEGATDISQNTDTLRASDISQATDINAIHPEESIVNDQSQVQYISDESLLQTQTPNHVNQALPLIFNFPMQSQMLPNQLSYFLPGTQFSIAGNQFSLPLGTQFSLPILSSSNTSQPQFPTAFIPQLSSFPVPLQNMQNLQQSMLQNFSLPQNVPYIQNIQLQQTVQSFSNVISGSNIFSGANVISGTDIQLSTSQSIPCVQDASVLTQQYSNTQQTPQEYRTTQHNPQQYSVAQQTPEQMIQQQIIQQPGYQPILPKPQNDEWALHPRPILPAPPKETVVQNKFSLLNPDSIDVPSFASVAAQAQSVSTQAQPSITQVAESHSGSLTGDIIQPDFQDLSVENDNLDSEEETGGSISPPHTRSRKVEEKNKSSLKQATVKETVKKSKVNGKPDRKSSESKELGKRLTDQFDFASDDNSEMKTSQHHTRSRKFVKITKSQTESKAVKKPKARPSDIKQSVVEEAANSSSLTEQAISVEPSEIAQENVSPPHTRSRKLIKQQDESDSPFVIQGKSKKHSTRSALPDSNQEDLDNTRTQLTRRKSSRIEKDNITQMTTVTPVTRLNLRSTRHSRKSDQVQDELPSSIVKQKQSPSEVVKGDVESVESKVAESNRGGNVLDVMPLTDELISEMTDDTLISNMESDIEDDVGEEFDIDEPSEIEAPIEENLLAADQEPSESIASHTNVKNSNTSKQNVNSSESKVFDDRETTENENVKKRDDHTAKGSTSTTVVSSDTQQNDPAANMQNKNTEVNKGDQAGKDTQKTNPQVSPSMKSNAVKLPRIPHDQLIGIARRLYKPPGMSSKQKYELVKSVIHEALEKVKALINVEENASFEELLVKELNDGLNTCKELHDGLSKSRNYPKLAISKDLSTLKILIFWDSGKEPCTLTIKQSQIPTRQPKPILDLANMSEPVCVSNLPGSGQYETQGAVASPAKQVYPKHYSVSSTPNKKSLPAKVVKVSPQSIPKPGQNVLAAKSVRVPSQAVIPMKVVRENHSTDEEEKEQLQSMAKQEEAKQTQNIATNKSVKESQIMAKQEAAKESLTEVSNISVKEREKEDFRFKWAAASFKGRTYNRKRKSDELDDTHTDAKNEMEKDALEAFEKAKKVGCTGKAAQSDQADTAENTSMTSGNTDSIIDSSMPDTSSVADDASHVSIIHNEANNENNTKESDSDKADTVVINSGTHDESEADDTDKHYLSAAELMARFNKHNASVNQTTKVSPKANTTNQHYEDQPVEQSPNQSLEYCSKFQINKDATKMLNEDDMEVTISPPHTRSKKLTKTDEKTSVIRPNKDKQNRKDSTKMETVNKTTTRCTRSKAVKRKADDLNASEDTDDSVLTELDEVFSSSDDLERTTRSRSKQSKTEKKPLLNVEPILSKLFSSLGDGKLTAQEQPSEGVVQTKMDEQQVLYIEQCEKDALETVDRTGEPADAEQVAIKASASGDVTANANENPQPDQSNNILDDSFTMDEFESDSVKNPQPDQSNNILDDSFTMDEFESDSVKDAVEHILGVLDGPTEKAEIGNENDDKENSKKEEICEENAEKKENSENSEICKENDVIKETQKPEVSEGYDKSQDNSDGTKMHEETPTADEYLRQQKPWTLRNLNRQHSLEMKKTRSKSLDSGRQAMGIDYKIKNCYVKLENINVEKVLSSKNLRSMGREFRKFGSSDCILGYRQLDIKECFVKLQKIEINLKALDHSFKSKSDEITVDASLADHGDCKVRQLRINELYDTNTSKTTDQTTLNEKVTVNEKGINKTEFLMESSLKYAADASLGMLPNTDSNITKAAFAKVTSYKDLGNTASVEVTSDCVAMEINTCNGDIKLTKQKITDLADEVLTHKRGKENEEIQGVIGTSDYLFADSQTGGIISANKNYEVTVERNNLESQADKETCKMEQGSEVCVPDGSIEKATDTLQGHTAIIKNTSAMQESQSDKSVQKLGNLAVIGQIVIKTEKDETQQSGEFSQGSESSVVSRQDTIKIIVSSDSYIKIENCNENLENCESCVQEPKEKDQTSEGNHVLPTQDMNKITSESIRMNDIVSDSKVDIPSEDLATAEHVAEINKIEQSLEQGDLLGEELEQQLPTQNIDQEEDVPTVEQKPELHLPTSYIFNTKVDSQVSIEMELSSGQELSSTDLTTIADTMNDMIQILEKELPITTLSSNKACDVSETNQTSEQLLTFITITNEGDTEPQHVCSTTKGDPEPRHVHSTNEGNAEPRHVHSTNEGDAEPRHVHSTNEGDAEPRHVHSSNEGDPEPRHMHSSNECDAETQHVHSSNEGDPEPHHVHSATEGDPEPHHVHSSNEGDAEPTHMHSTLTLTKHSTEQDLPCTDMSDDDTNPIDSYSKVIPDTIYNRPDLVDVQEQDFSNISTAGAEDSVSNSSPVADIFNTEDKLEDPKDSKNNFSQANSTELKKGTPSNTYVGIQHNLILADHDYSKNIVEVSEIQNDDVEEVKMKNDEEITGVNSDQVLLPLAKDQPNSEIIKVVGKRRRSTDCFCEEVRAKKPCTEVQTKNVPTRRSSADGLLENTSKSDSASSLQKTFPVLSNLLHHKKS